VWWVDWWQELESVNSKASLKGQKTEKLVWGKPELSLEAELVLS
jgi:hypothetical protein